MTTSVPGLEAARIDLGLAVADLWVRCLGLGGSLTIAELDAYLHDGGTAGRGDHNVIVHVLNEAYAERGRNHPLGYTDA